MKKFKVISMLLSGVMALSALGSLAVSAEEEKIYTFSELEAMSDEEFFELKGARYNYERFKYRALCDQSINQKFIGPLEANKSYKPGETENTLKELFGDIDLSITSPYTTNDTTVDYIKVTINDFNYDEKISDECCLYVAKSFYCLSQICNLTYDDSDFLLILPNITYGDANNDGIIDIRDAAFIARKIAGRKSSELGKTADYNQDGKQDICDAAAIAKYVAGKR